MTTNKPKADLFLCKPNKTIISKLTEAYEVNLNIKAFQINELNFKLPLYIDKNNELIYNSNIDKARYRYLIKLVYYNPKAANKFTNQIDYTMIDNNEVDIDEDYEGTYVPYTEYYRISIPKAVAAEDAHYKEYTCLCLADELKDRFIGTYEITSYTLEQVFNGKPSENMPGILRDTNWSIDDRRILSDVYRSLNVNNATILDIILNHIVPTYNVLPIFDTVNRIIYIYTPDQIGKTIDKDILRISYQKYLNTFDLTEDDSEFTTRLRLKGGEDTTIHEISPTGQPYLEDFSYFLNGYEYDQETEQVVSSSPYWSDELCQSQIDYEKKVAEYDGHLTDINLDMTGNYSILSDNPISFNNNVFTIELWIYCQENNLFLVNSNNDNFIIFLEAGIIKIKINEKIFNTEYTTPQDKWKHLAISFDNEELKLYIDSNLQYSETLESPAEIIEDSEIIIGKDFADIKISDFRFWHRLRYFAEIRHNYNKRFTGQEYKLELYLPLNDLFREQDKANIVKETEIISEDEINQTTTIKMTFYKNHDFENYDQIKIVSNIFTGMLSHLNYSIPIEENKLEVTINNEDFVNENIDTVVGFCRKTNKVEVKDLTSNKNNGIFDYDDPESSAAKWNHKETFTSWLGHLNILQKEKADLDVELFNRYNNLWRVRDLIDVLFGYGNSVYRFKYEAVDEEDFEEKTYEAVLNKDWYYFIMANQTIPQGNIELITQLKSLQLHEDTWMEIPAEESYFNVGQRQLTELTITPDVEDETLSPGDERVVLEHKGSIFQKHASANSITNINSSEEGESLIGIVTTEEPHEFSVSDNVLIITELFSGYYNVDEVDNNNTFRFSVSLDDAPESINATRGFCRKDNGPLYYACSHNDFAIKEFKQMVGEVVTETGIKFECGNPDNPYMLNFNEDCYGEINNNDYIFDHANDFEVSCGIFYKGSSGYIIENGMNYTLGIDGYGRVTAHFSSTETTEEVYSIENIEVSEEEGEEENYYKITLESSVEEESIEEGNVLKIIDDNNNSYFYIVHRIVDDSSFIIYGEDIDIEEKTYVEAIKTMAHVIEEVVDYEEEEEEEEEEETHLYKVTLKTPLAANLQELDIVEIRDVNHNYYYYEVQKVIDDNSFVIYSEDLSLEDLNYMIVTKAEITYITSTNQLKKNVTNYINMKLKDNKFKLRLNTVEQSIDITSDPLVNSSDKIIVGEFMGDSVIDNLSISIGGSEIGKWKNYSLNNTQDFFFNELGDRSLTLHGNNLKWEHLYFEHILYSTLEEGNFQHYNNFSKNISILRDVFIYDGHRTVKFLIWLDGRVLLSFVDKFNTLPFINSNVTTQFTLGSENEFTFQGRFNNIRIWEIAKSMDVMTSLSTRIRNFLSKRLLGTEDGLLAYWPMDFSTEDIDDDLDTPIVIKDITSNEKDILIYNNIVDNKYHWIHWYDKEALIVASHEDDINTKDGWFILNTIDQRSKIYDVNTDTLKIKIDKESNLDTEVNIIRITKEEFDKTETDHVYGSSEVYGIHLGAAEGTWKLYYTDDDEVIHETEEMLHDISLEDFTTQVVDLYNEYIVVKKTGEGEYAFFTLIFPYPYTPSRLEADFNEMEKTEAHPYIIKVQEAFGLIEKYNETLARKYYDEKVETVGHKQQEIDAVKIAVQDIRNELSLDSNFSEDLIVERNNFIVEKEYHNNDILNAYDLLEAGKEYFKTINEPALVLNLDLVNFMAIIEHDYDYDKLFYQNFRAGLYDTIVIRHEKYNLDISCMILEIAYNFDDSEISFAVSNVRNNLDDTEKFLSVLNFASSGAAITLNEKYKWDGAQEKTTELEDILFDTWDTARAAIEGGVDNCVTIDRGGIRIVNPEDPNQLIAIVAGYLGISDDGGMNYRSVINADGIAAKYLIGNIVLAAKMHIINQGGNIDIDESGIKVFDQLGVLRIHIGNLGDDPDDASSYGFYFRGKNDPETGQPHYIEWKDDTLEIAGNLNAVTGTFRQLQAGVQGVGHHPEAGLHFDNTGIKWVDTIGRTLTEIVRTYNGQQLDGGVLNLYNADYLAGHIYASDRHTLQISADIGSTEGKINIPSSVDIHRNLAVGGNVNIGGNCRVDGDLVVGGRYPGADQTSGFPLARPVSPAKWILQMETLVFNMSNGDIISANTTKNNVTVYNEKTEEFESKDNFPVGKYISDFKKKR